MTVIPAPLAGDTRPASVAAAVVTAYLPSGVMSEGMAVDAHSVARQILTIRKDHYPIVLGSRPQGLEHPPA